MSNASPTREERLAAKLRENLRRRKAQARAINPSHRDADADGADADGAGADGNAGDASAQNESGGVPKGAPES